MRIGNVLWLIGSLMVLRSRSRRCGARADRALLEFAPRTSVPPPSDVIRRRRTAGRRTPRASASSRIMARQCAPPCPPRALILAAPAHAREKAPGAPGDKARWAKADKHGFGTSASRSSRVWFTLRQTEMTEVYYPDLSHPSARALEFMVDGKPVTDRDRRQRRAHLHADERDPGVAAHPHVRHRPRARDGADQGALRVQGRRGAQRRDRVRPAALQRRQRRRRLEPRHGAARPRPPHRERAGRPPEPHAHELGLQGPRRVHAARAHLRRAAARQRHPAGAHAPHRAAASAGT